MANLRGAARSNYFSVRPELWDEFKTYCEFFDITIEEADTAPDGPILIHGGNTDTGTWPSWSTKAKTPEFLAADIDTDFGAVEWKPLKQMPKYLCDDEVVILVEAGNEKLRYVYGYAFAFNNKGKMVEIGTGQINDLAKTLTRNPDTLDLLP